MSGASGEGAYLEVPFLGPSTERDLVGTVVDIALDPVNIIASTNEHTAITIGRLTAKVGNRQRFADTYESILYDSADSYAQARLLYLQNRHYELGIEEETFDPYEDPYAAVIVSRREFAALGAGLVAAAALPMPAALPLMLKRRAPSSTA